MAGMRSGQVARQSGVNVETLRYYERRGILQAPQRRESGYREYSEDTVGVIRFVKRAQELGFSLDEIEALLSLANGGPESCDSARSLAAHKLAELDAKMRSISAMQESLRRLVATCEMPRDERECPLLDALEQGHETSTRGCAS